MVSRVTALHRGLLLYGLLTLTASQTVTEYYAVIGESYTLPLDYKPLNKDDELTWKHGDTVILRRKLNAFSWGKKEDIDAAGSLTLKDLKPQNAGVYTAKVYDNNGHSQKVWTGKLNILEKVKKPTVKYDCPTGESTSVSFTCVVPSSQGLTFSWTLHGKDLGGKSSHTLQKSLSELKSVKKVTCMVKNKANKQESSDAINPTCEEAPGFLDLFGFGFWPMVAILAAGGSLALLLLITTLVCCCRAKHRNQRRQEENEELRLQWSQQQPDVDPLPTPSQQRRPRHPIPRATGQAAAQPKAQASNRPPQACSNEEEEEAPPLPRPRKKKHHNPQQQC